MFEGRPLTTRGRWMNPLVFCGLRLCAMLPISVAVDRPIFILGTGRSGTTILGTILALHRNAAYLNEPKALWQAALGNDDLIGSYCKIPGQFRHPPLSKTDPARRRIRRSYHAFLRLSGNTRVIDKYPELLFRNAFLKDLFPDARKIVLIRNGADTLQSIERWSVRNGRQAGGTVDDWWGKDRRKWLLLVDQIVADDHAFADALPVIRNFDRHTDMAAVEWIATMREALKIQATDPDILMLRYENLAYYPRASMGAVLDFCGLSRDETMLAFAEAELRAPPLYPMPELDPCIQKLFGETMVRLGYRTEF